MQVSKLSLPAVPAAGDTVEPGSDGEVFALMMTAVLGAAPPVAEATPDGGPAGDAWAAGSDEPEAAAAAPDIAGALAASVCRLLLAVPSPPAGGADARAAQDGLGSARRGATPAAPPLRPAEPGGPAAPAPGLAHRAVPAVPAVPAQPGSDGAPAVPAVPAVPATPAGREPVDLGPPEVGAEPQVPEAIADLDPRIDRPVARASAPSAPSPALSPAPAAPEPRPVASVGAGSAGNAAGEEAATAARRPVSLPGAVPSFAPAHGAAAPDGSRPAAPAPPEAVEQIVEVLEPFRTAPDGASEVTLELRPAELGAVRVEIRVDHGIVHLRLQADQDGTADLLRHSVPDLRAALEEAGLAAGSLGVGVGGGGSQPGGSRRAAGWEGDDRPSGRAVGRGRAVTDGVSSPRPRQSTANAAAGLDVLL